MTLAFMIGGHAAGRAEPSSWPPPEGDWIFLFGGELDGLTEDIDVGEETAISQTVDFTSLALVTFAVRFRQTSQVGASFQAFIAIAGVDQWTLEPGGNVSVQYARRALNVYHKAGDLALTAGIRRIS